MARNYTVGLNEKYKQLLIDIIEKHLPSTAIYLYGSRAYGKAEECSDVDIAVDAGAVIELGILFKINDDIEESSIPFFVDVVDVYSVSEKFKLGIKKEWVVWKK